MANKFGSYSNVPRSSGLGQGAAQVFAPEPIALDTSELGRGLQNLAGGVAQNIKNKNAQKAKDAAELKKIQDIQAGTTPLYTGLFRNKVDKLMETALNEDLTQAQINELTSSVSRIKQDTENAEKLSVELYKEAMKDPNKMARDPNTNEWRPEYEILLERLSQSPNESDIELNDQGLAAQSVLLEMGEVEKGSLKYDPNFNAESVINESFAKFAPQSKEVRAIVSELGQGDGEYDFKKVISSMNPNERNKFINQIKKDEYLMRKWVDNRAVKMGQRRSDLTNEEELDLVRAAWEEEVEDIATRLPSEYKESGSIVKSGDGSGSKSTPVFGVIDKTPPKNVKETPWYSGFMDAATTARGKEKSIASKYSLTVPNLDNPTKAAENLRSQVNNSGMSETKKEDAIKEIDEFEGAVKYLEKTGKYMIEINNILKQDGARRIEIYNEKKPTEQLPVAIEDKDGVLVSGVLMDVIYNDKTGDGYAIVAESANLNESESGESDANGRITQSQSQKLYNPTPVKVNKNDLKTLQEKYGVQLFDTQPKKSFKIGADGLPIFE